MEGQFNKYETTELDYEMLLCMRKLEDMELNEETIESFFENINLISLKIKELNLDLSEKTKIDRKNIELDLRNKPKNDKKNTELDLNVKTKSNKKK